MFSSKSVLVSMAAACMLVSLPSCNKRVEVNSAADMSIDWAQENVNSLLAFVPEDSPLVFASTRQVGLNHPIFELLRGQYEKLLVASEKFLERAIGPVYDGKELDEILGEAAPDERFELIAN